MVNYFGGKKGGGWSKKMFLSNAASPAEQKWGKMCPLLLRHLHPFTYKIQNQVSVMNAA